MMRDLMIDLETLATRPDAAIVTIGACLFDITTGEIGKTFYGKVDLADAMRHGKVNGDTLKWWLNQGDEARKELLGGVYTAKVIFNEFEDFITKNANCNRLRAWGNGSVFDITMMEFNFPRITGMEAPWRFWNVRDCRTIKDVGETAGYRFTEERSGTHHAALDDAIYQAKYTSFYWRCLVNGAAPDASPEQASDQFEDLLG